MSKPILTRKAVNDVCLELINMSDDCEECPGEYGCLSSGGYGKCALPAVALWIGKKLLGEDGYRESETDD